MIGRICGTHGFHFHKSKIKRDKPFEYHFMLEQCVSHERTEETKGREKKGK